MNTVPITIDPDLPASITDQITAQVVTAIRQGVLTAGTTLPTVRQLASDLGVHANTVARAYRQLESEGHVETLGRNGTRVRPPRPHGDADELRAAAVLLARSAQRQGMSLEQAIGELRRAW